MTTPKRIAWAGAAALLVTLAYGVQSQGTPTGKAASRQYREQLLRMKKDKLAAKAQLDLQTAQAGGQAVVSGSGASAGRSRDHEPNNTPSEATRLGTRMVSGLGALAGEVSSSVPYQCSQDYTVYGVIDPAGDEDYYAVTLLEGDLLQISIDSDKEGAPSDLDLTVYGPAAPGDVCGPELAMRDDGNGFSGVTTDPCTFIEAPSTGKYLIRVSDVMGCFGPSNSYRLTVRVITNREVEPNDNPGGFGMEPPMVGLVECVGATNTCAVVDSGTPSATVRQAEFVDNVGSVSGPGGADSDMSSTVVAHRANCIGGTINPDGDRDCFQVAASVGQVIHASLDGFKCASQTCPTIFDPELTLYDPSGVVVATDDDTDDLDPGLLYTVGTAGSYSVCITDHTNSGSPCYYYLLHVEIAGCNGEAADNGCCEGAGGILCRGGIIDPLPPAGLCGQ